MRGVEKGGMAVLEGNPTGKHTQARAYCRPLHTGKHTYPRGPYDAIPTGKHTVICIVSSAHRGLWIPIATGKHMEAYRKAHNE